MTAPRLEQEALATGASAPQPGPDGPGIAAVRPAWGARLHLGGLLVHGLLAVLFTWPLVLDLGGNGLTPGTMVEDRNQNLWNLWWVKTALLDLHTNPFHSDWIYWPDGVSLQFHTLNIFNGLVSIPFQAFLPLPVIYDGIVLGSFVLTGWGAYLLLWYLLARPAGGNARPGQLGAAATLGSSIFTYSAYHLATQRGLLQLISLEWVPFAVLFLLQAVHAPPAGGDLRAAGRWLIRRALPAAGFLLLVALVDWYYVMYTLLFAGVYGLYVGGRALLARQGAGGRALSPAVRAGLVVGLFFVFASPLLVPMFAELQQTSYMRPAPGVAVENSADLLAFFIPPRFQRLWSGLSDFRLSWPFGNNSYEVYLGYVALALALVGLSTGRTAVWAGARAAGPPAGVPLPSRAFWAGGAVLFALLALGPVLQVNGVAQPWLQPMPYTLIERIPGLNISRSPDRFAMPLMLCLSVLAGYGVLRLAARVPGPPQALAGGLLVLLAIELWPVPYPQIAAPIPAYYQTLGQDPADYAILELPREDSYWHGAYRMYFQTAHHKRIFYGYISREYYHAFLFSTPGFMELQNPDQRGDLFADGPPEWLSALAQYQTRYVVLYKAGWRPRPPADETDRYRAALAQVIGAAAVAHPVHSDADLDLYQVPAPATPVPYLVLGTGWGPREAAPGEAHRWIRNDATLQIQSPRPFHGVLVFQATALGSPRALLVRRDGDSAVPLTVDAVPREYRADLGQVPAGTSTLLLSSPGAVTSPKELGMNEDTRPLGIAFSKVRLEQVP
ncbi:MAG TPA: hypothetical protein VKY74_26540 [Chloroflexia bacterium]|nr:hypothetical protein [Chloroflexia bacterium]